MKVITVLTTAELKKTLAEKTIILTIVIAIRTMPCLWEIDLKWLLLTRRVNFCFGRQYGQTYTKIEGYQETR